MIMYCRELAKAVKARVVLKNWNSTENQINLSVISVGEDPASQSYIKSKEKACSECGFDFTHYELYDGVEEKEVLDLINRLNNDEKVTGILVQLPLPKHLDAIKITEAINPIKDVDGFHPINIGRLAQKGREPLFIPATPAGVMYLLEDSGVELSGANAVVLGRSNIVGMPVSLLLVRANATVTICHSRTKDIPALIREADVLVAAVGMPEFVRGDWLKPGAVVIDVGINRIEDATRKSGYRLVGDVAFDEAVEVAGAITPVPGGVGPMTIAVLLQNTLRAARLADGNKNG